MSNIRHINTVVAGIGGEVVRAQLDNTFSCTDREDTTTTLAVAAGDGNVTLWDSSTSKVAAPTFIGLYVDPGMTLSMAFSITVELTVDAVVVAFHVSRNVPLCFGSVSGGAAIDTIDGTISKVRARNHNAADAVAVRLVVMG